MEVFRTLPPPADRRPCALTIGNFDGVHLGHQAILARLGELSAAQGLARCVLTFEPHPREFFASRQGDRAAAARAVPPRVQPERDKLEALAAHGVDRVCIANFNESLASTSADDFIEQIILNGLQARELLVGDDFRFGARRTGDYALLAAHARSDGFNLHQADTVMLDGSRVSSSRVRDALAAADFAAVERLLGRRYTISGHVVRGRQLGRELGFPTLNLRLPFLKPALAGIFVVRVRGIIDGMAMPAVASLGTRPAVEQDGRYLLEVHLIDYSGDCYGRLVQVEFLQRLRDEAHFPSLEALSRQIAIDTDQARAWFTQADCVTGPT